MGDAQSAQREGKLDAAAEEEGGKVDDAQTEKSVQHQTLTNNGKVSEINKKAGESIAEANGRCENANGSQAILSTEDKRKTLKESHNEADEDAHLELNERDAKENDINASFRRFFSNIGLKLTIKRGSLKPTDELGVDEPSTTEDSEDAPKGIRGEKAEQNTDESIAQKDVTTDGILEKGEKTRETKGEVESDNTATASLSEDKQQDEEEPHSTSPTIPESEMVLSPTKRFFATGIFSGLRKKKKITEEETTDKELEDMGGKDVLGRTEQTVQRKQKDKNVTRPSLGAEQKDAHLKDEKLSTASPQMTDKEKSLSRDPSANVTEPEILGSQDKDKVQAGPVKRFLSGSGLKKLSTKRRSSRSSEATLSDSGEHVLDQVLLSESAENHKEDAAEAAREDDSAWAFFKKRMTPKRHSKASCLNEEETQIYGSVEESKSNERGQISDQSTEGVKKRKDSSVSWEAVLCGSGRRRSRKTSDSDDEAPQMYKNVHKQDRGCKHSAESPLESSNDYEILASSPKQPEGPSEGDGGSAWESLKRIVTPKRKVKDEEESIKGNVHIDNEVTQDDSSFSIKKLIPGRKKQKPGDKQDQVSSDEADKNVASGDEDSETPAVVPLSEFDTVETDVLIQTEEDTKSCISKEENDEIKQDEMPKPVLATSHQDIDNAGEKQEATTFAPNKKTDDLIESISKNQQLSDISEEGMITEAMATPASVTEEPERDDTIAEDLTEITSDAITATEPIPDYPLAEKTEMISTFSQLSPRLSKVSGNTTPVQAEYDIVETDTILQQAAETISINQSEAPLCSDDLNSEKIVASVSHSALETFVNNGPTILDLDREFDATAIKTGLKVEEIDDVDELAAASIKESISEVQDMVSTEVVPEVSAKESEMAEIEVDELQQADITHQKESVHELESVEESSYLMESLDADVSVDTLSEADKAILQVCSLDEPHQAEAKPPKIDFEEAHLTSTVSDESEDSATRQVETLKEKEDQIQQSHITNQIQVEDKEKPSINVEELQELSKDKVTTLDSEGSNEPLEGKVTLEDMLTDESETKKMENEHIQVNEALQASSLNPEEANVQSPEEKVKSEDTPQLETVIDEPEQMTELLSVAETDTEEQPVKPDDVQQPEVLQATSLDSEESTIPSTEKEVQSENMHKEEKDTEEPKEETLLPPQDSLEPVGDSKTVQEQDVLQIVQTPSLDSEEGNIQQLDKDVISENVSKAETVTEKPKEELMLLTEANLEPEDVSNTPQDIQELQDTQEPALHPEEGIIQTCEKEVISETHSGAETDTEEQPVRLDDVQQPEVLQETSLDSEESTIPSTEKEVQSENMPKEEKDTEEPKDETSLLTPVSLEPVGDSKPAQEPDVLQIVQTPSLDSEEGNIQFLDKDVISENVSKAETVTEKPKEELMLLTEANLEPEDVSNTPQDIQELQDTQEPALHPEEGIIQTCEKEVISDTDSKAETDTNEQPVKPDDVQQPEVLQETSLDSEESTIPSTEKEVQSENMPKEEKITEEPKEETLPPPQDNLEPVGDSKPAQEPDVLQIVQTPSLDAEEGNIQQLDKDVISENVSKAETVTEKPKEELMLLTEANLEPEDVSNTPQDIQELQDTQEPALHPEEGIIQTCEKEVISETHSGAETEPEEQPVKPDDVQQPEVLQETSLDSEESTIPSTEKEVQSENMPKEEKVTEEPKDETSLLTPVSLEPVDASETVQEPQVSQDAQAATFSSETGSPQSLNIEAQSKDLTVETVADQPEQDNENKKVVLEEKLVVEECKTEHAVQESSVNEELSNVQVSGETVSYGDTTAPCVNNAAVADEPKQEVNLTTQQISVEQEIESGAQSIEMKTDTSEQALLPQTVQNNLNDVSEAVADTLIEKTSEMTEPSIDTVAAEQALNEKVQDATTLMKDDVAGTEEKDDVIVTAQVPSVVLEDNHSIEMQMVDETSEDPAVKEGVIEAKPVIDVCCENTEKLDTLSATTGTKEEVLHEEVTIVTQDVKDTGPESLVGNLEQEDTKNQDSITSESEMAGCESREMDHQTAVEDSTEEVLEQKHEAPTTINDSAPEQQVSTDVIQKPEIQGDSDISSHDHIEDLEETKAELEKNEENTAVEKEGQTTSEEEQAPTMQVPSPTVTSNNTESEVPQNTGVVSSQENEDVQLGDQESPASQPETAQIIAPVKKTNVSEVGVQAVEADEPINPTQQAESKTKTKTVAVAVQTTESMINVEQLRVSLEATKAVSSVDEIISSDRVTSTALAAETAQPVTQTEQKEQCLGQQVASETKAEEPMQQTDKDHDAHMNVEKVVCNQEETEESLCDKEEPPEHQKASEEGDKPELGREVETVKEDFAEAVESPEKGTTSITN